MGGHNSIEIVLISLYMDPVRNYGDHTCKHARVFFRAGTERLIMSDVVPPTHPEAQHFVLHEKHIAPAKHKEPDEGNGADVQDAAINYLEAMAGFMGVVDAPKEVDPEAEAAAAVTFLETLWGNEAVEVWWAGLHCHVKQHAVR